MTKIILPILVIVLISGFALYAFINQVRIDKNASSQVSVFSFEECVQSKDSQIIKTYPRQCSASDGKTFLETINEPIKTDAWEVFNEDLGFTFLCPPSWLCKKSSEDAATISQDHYLNISVFQVNKITPQNFQESLVRNPNYKTPIAWFKDLKVKKAVALNVLPETIKQGRPGTDEKIPPRYYNFKFDKMSELETKSGKALVFPGEGFNPDTSILIPLNETDLIIVTLSPSSLYEDPIVKTILSSVSSI